MPETLDYIQDKANGVTTGEKKCNLPDVSDSEERTEVCPECNGSGGSWHNNEYQPCFLCRGFG